VILKRKLSENVCQEDQEGTGRIWVLLRRFYEDVCTIVFNGVLY